MFFFNFKPEFPVIVGYCGTDKQAFPVDIISEHTKPFITLNI